MQFICCCWLTSFLKLEFSVRLYVGLTWPRPISPPLLVTMMSPVGSWHYSHQSRRWNSGLGYVRIAIRRSIKKHSLLWKLLHLDSSNLWVRVACHKLSKGLVSCWSCLESYFQYACVFYEELKTVMSLFPILQWYWTFPCMILNCLLLTALLGLPCGWAACVDDTIMTWSHGCRNSLTCYIIL